MPLSEREQQILEEIERGLAADDPAFGRPGSTIDRKRVRFAVAAFAAGLVLLLMFLVTRFLLAGVLAFGAMVWALAQGIPAAGRLLRARIAPPEPRAGSGLFGRWEARMRRRNPGP